MEGVEYLCEKFKLGEFFIRPVHGSQLKDYKFGKSWKFALIGIGLNIKFKAFKKFWDAQRLRFKCDWL